MLNVIYAECHLCCVSLCLMSFILNVIMLSVNMLGVIMLIVVAPVKGSSKVTNIKDKIYNKLKQHAMKLSFLNAVHVALRHLAKGQLVK